MIRWTTIAVLLGSLVAGVLFDRVEHSDIPADPELDTAIVTPVLSEPALHSSDWYCPVGSTSENGFAKHTVYVSNLSDQPALATIETLTEAGPGSALRLDLAPRTTEVIDLATLAEGDAVAAIVEVTGGEGVVGHRVVSATGVAEGPCSTATAPQWFFGGGVTTRDTHYYLSVMNPSLNAIVFGATFHTDTRVREPKDLESRVVPAKSVLLIDVTEFVAREPLVAAEIRTVQGQVVVERLQTFDGTLGPVGATLQLGVTHPKTQWTFASGLLTETSDNRLAITNPTESTAEIDLFLDPADPADLLSYGLLPRELSIAPGRTILIDLDQAAAEVGLILPYELGVRVVSANGIPIVAERWHFSPGIDESLIGAGGENARIKNSIRQDGESDEIPVEELEGVESDTPLLQPIPDLGVAMSRGVEQPSTRWVVPWVTLAPDGGTSLVLSAGEAGASVEARLLVAGEWQPPIRAIVQPDGRVVLPISSVAEAAPIVITASAPIVVEAQVIIPGQRHDVVPAIPTLQR